MKAKKYIIPAVIVIAIIIGVVLYRRRQKRLEAMKPEGIPGKKGLAGAFNFGKPTIPKGGNTPPPAPPPASAAAPVGAPPGRPAPTQWPLQMGSKGDRVVALQKALKIGADGTWGEKTEQAVAMAMEKYKLLTNQPVKLNQVIYHALLNKLKTQ